MLSPSTYPGTRYGYQKYSLVGQRKSSPSTYNLYIFGNATQEWQDKEHNIKLLFTPPEYPYVGNTTQLTFSVQDLKTGSHKNETATVTVINNFTANIGNGVDKGAQWGLYHI